jgi:DNA-binding CsgD family transcriptional regulator
VSRGAVVGRRREIAAIADAFAGQARLVVVTGEAGVGKSALVSAASAASSRTVLVASCLPLTETLPLLPIADLLRAAAELDPTWLGSALADCPPYVAPALQRLVPDQISEESSALADPADPWLRQQLFAAVASVMSRLAAGRALMLVVEDAHWADSSTLDLVSVVAAGRHEWTVPTLITFRTDDLSTPPSTIEWLDRLQMRPEVRSLQLSALDAGETAELIAMVTGTWPTPATAQQIFARSDGNPLFVEQLCRSGPDTLPPSLVIGYARTLASLGAEARALARVLAVVARPISHADLAALWPVAPEDVDTAVRELRAAHLLDPRVARSRLRLRHALLADVIADEIPRAESCRLHDLAAQWLTRCVTPPPYAEIAAHLQRADQPRDELIARAAAASEAQDLRAHAEEADHRLRMLELWDAIPDASELTGTARLDTILATDWALFDSGQSERDAVMLRRTLESLPTSAVRERATLTRRLARAAAWHDEDEATRLMEEAGELFDRAPGGLDFVLMLADLTDLRRLQGRYEEALENADRALAACRAEPGLGLERSVVARRALCLAFAGRDDDALVAIDALADAAAGTLRERTVAAARQFEALTRLDQDAAVPDAAAELLAEAEEYGAYGSRLINMLRSHVALAHARLGRIDETRRLTEQALRDSPPEDAAMFDRSRAELAIVASELGSAERLLKARAAPFAGWHSERLDAAERLAETLLWAGRPGEAITVLEELLEPMSHSGLASITGPALVTLARARADAAEVRLVERDVQHLARLRSAMQVDPLARPQLAALWDAEVSRLTGQSDAAAWHRAAELHDQLGRCFVAAYCSWREALALLARRARADAAPVLRAAHALARDHGPLTDAITQTARAARVELVDDAAPDVDEQATNTFGLTARELEVLGELATGKTNPQIGSTLFMSPKTVSVHVSSIMRKVEATSRTQAVAIAQRAGLVE